MPRARRLPLNRIGKVLLPTEAEDGPQLDLLEERARGNRRRGRAARRSAALARIEPEARSATGEALFVPGTSVVSSADVMASIVAEAKASRHRDPVRRQPRPRSTPSERELDWAGERIAYGHAVNAAGLHADSVAHRFGVGRRYHPASVQGASTGSSIRPRASTSAI